MNELSQSLSDVNRNLEVMNTSLEQIAPTLEKISSRFDRLERRESVAGGVAGLVVSVLVLVAYTAIGGGA